MKCRLACVAMIILAGVLTGCATRERRDVPAESYENISVTVRDGLKLKDVISSVAARRGWVPSDVGENTLRLQINQRSNVVVVDAVVLDPTHYSLRYVKSNIPERKYTQWVVRLMASISKAAAKE